jgi:histidine triad (HIT) family protein
MEDCIFCRIAQGKAPASVIHDDKDIISFLDINPVQRGHALVIPKRHFVDIWDIEPETLARVMEVTKGVARSMQEVMEVEGVNTFSASGKPAGQDVYHFHIHVIPLARGERTKFVEWWKGAMGRAQRSELDGLADRLRF